MKQIACACASPVRARPGHSRRTTPNSVRPRIHPLEAVRIVSYNILAHFEVVPIERQDYLEALRAAGNVGWSGAKIYDSLLLG